RQGAAGRDPRSARRRPTARRHLEEVPVMSAATSAPDRFESLAELQGRHADLVKEVGTDVLAPGNAETIAEFVRRALATGTVLDTKDERAVAQGLINFWTSRLSSAARAAERMEVGKSLAGASGTSGTDGKSLAQVMPQFEDTLLAEFDATAVRSAGEAADRWLATLPPSDRDLALRVLMRLVSLSADGRDFTFTPVPR